MTKQKPDETYLWDMLTAARNVLQIIETKTLTDYRAEMITRSAVERQIEIIGEAARFVSQTFRDSHPEIAWRPIIAQRHILAHDYGEIDDERIWNVALVHIPELITQLKSLVRKSTDTDTE